MCVCLCVSLSLYREREREIARDGYLEVKYFCFSFRKRKAKLFGIWAFDLFWNCESSISWFNLIDPKQGKVLWRKWNIFSDSDRGQSQFPCLSLNTAHASDASCPLYFWPPAVRSTLIDSSTEIYCFLSLALNSYLYITLTR